MPASPTALTNKYSSQIYHDRSKIAAKLGADCGEFVKTYAETYIEDGSSLDERTP